MLLNFSSQWSIVWYFFLDYVDFLMHLHKYFFEIASALTKLFIEIG